jgi:hypothetical protein
MTLLSSFSVTTTADSGAGSLRSALTASNLATGQTNSISFNITGTGVHKIALLSALPTITNPVVIDATTINGYTTSPLIELDGTNAKAGTTGLTIAATAPGTTIKGLDLHSFGGDGIDVLATGVVLSANYIGTGPTGLSAAPNHGSGVVVRGSNNTIGGFNIFNPDGTFQVMGGNLISGNAGNGVVLAGAGNVVQGNWIGVSATGKAALGNSHDGIVIDGVSLNTIGGTSAGTRNVISGNLGQGVSIANVFASLPPGGTSAGPLTLTAAGIAAGFSLSNFATNFPYSAYNIGPFGNAFLSNGGVLVSNATNAVYHFPTDTDGQVATAVPKVAYAVGTGDIAQIGSHIYMTFGSPPRVGEIDSSGNLVQIIAAVPSVYGMVVDTVPGPLFDHLLVMSDTRGSTPAAIYDVDPVAKTAKVAMTVPNGGDGMVFDPTSNTLYMAFDGFGVLGYNMSTKLKVFTSGQLPAGTNDADGISIGSGDLRNELFVNTNQGTIVEVSITSPPTYTIIASGGSRGDFAIVDPNNGTFLLSQTDRVVRLIPPLGGGFNGGPTTTTSSNVVEGNLIGLGSDGTTLVANSANGIMVSAGATGNTIGGTLAGQGNTIGANKLNGVAIVDPGTASNTVLGNSIGTDVSGNLLAGNVGDGVWLDSGVTSNQVAHNTIANNSVDGVGMNSATVGNAIHANQIYGNKGLGIDRGSGSTGDQSIPALTAAFGSATASYVIGTAPGASGTMVTVDFYANAVKDPSGYGQGQFYLGSTTVMANAGFQVLFPVGAAPGEWVSATTTSATGDTSGFAADVLVVQPQTSAKLTSSASTSTYGQGINFTATITSTPGATGTVQFQVDGMNLGQSVAINPSTGIATSTSIATLGAGTHTVTAIYSGDSLHNSVTTNFTQTVNKAHLTVTAKAATRTYGAANPAFVATLSGFVNGDTAAVVSGAASLITTATAASGVGPYPIEVMVGTLSAANYDFTPLVNGTLTVTKAALTVTADAKSVTYGQTLPPLTYVISGFLNGDTSAVVTGAPGLSTSSGKLAAGSYPIVVTAGNLSASNYTFPNLVNGMLTVAKAPLTVTADGEAKRVNDALPVFTYTVTGFVNGDTAAAISGTPTLSTTATASSPVGSYSIAVSAGTLTAANYTFQNLIPGTLVIGTESPTSYTGTGHVQPAIVRRVNGGAIEWFVKGDPTLTGSGGHAFGSSSLDVPLTGDFDGDGKLDLAVYRPSTAQWIVQESGSNYVSKQLATFGAANLDIPVPGNYNGSGTTMIAVYRPTTGQWYIKGMSGPITFTSFVKGDIPVPGDYDNVGHDELAIYRPSAGEWIIDGPSGVHKIKFGGPADVPVPAAFDALTTGNQALEPAVWRPSTGQLFIHGPNGNRMIQFAVGDIPVPGDYDGIGEPEVAVFRPGTGQWLVIGPNDKSPHVFTTYGGLVDIPTNSPYGYRVI